MDKASKYREMRISERYSIVVKNTTKKDLVLDFILGSMVTIILFVVLVVWVSL